MAELGVGYISIVPEVSKISPGIAKALGAAEATVAKHGDSMGSKLAAGLSTTLKGAALGVGAAAGGAIAAGLTKGMGRLTGIENAQASLRGLGHDAQSVQSIMDNALASVKGTAFGLEAAASVAASAVAAGVKPGTELERTLKLVGDAATIAGTDMSTMGAIVNKVATSDMMQMDVANQLMDAGIPILQMVAKEMGVTAAEARNLASEGKVSFEIFQSALEDGVGGAALEAGDTFQGAFANMGAAAGRVGATALEPFFGLAKKGFSGVTVALDGFNDRLKPAMASFSTWLQDKGVPAAQQFGQALKAVGQSDTVQSAIALTKDAFASLVATGQALLPVVINIGEALGKAGVQLGVAGWNTFVTVLSTASAALQAVAGPLETVTGFLKDHPGLVAAAIGAWGAYKTVPGILGGITSALAPVSSGLKSFGVSLSESVRYAKYFNPEMTTMQAGLAGVGYQATALARGGMSGLKGALSGIMGIFGGPWGIALAGAGVALAGVADYSSAASAAQKNVAASSHEAAEAQERLSAAVAGTTGELSGEGLAAAIDLANAKLTEFMELGKVNSKWQSNFGIGRQFLQEDVDELLAAGKSLQDAQSLAANRLESSYKTLHEQMDSMGISQEQLNEIVAQGGPAFDQLVQSLEAMGTLGGQHAADTLQRLRQEMQQSIDDAQNLSPEYVRVSDAVEALADASSNANDKMAALDTLMQEMGLRPKDTERAMRDAAEAIDQAVESSQNLVSTGEHVGQVLFDQAGKLDWSSESSRALGDEMDKLYDTLRKVAANGGDVSGTFESMQPALENLQQAFGLTDAQLQSVIEQMGLVPDSIETAMALTDADKVEQEIFGIISLLEGTPDGKQIQVEALTDEARAQLEAVGVNIESIPGSKNVLVSVGDMSAQEALDLLGHKTTTLPDGRIAITDTTEENLENLRKLGIEVSKPKNGKVVITDNAKVTAKAVRDELAQIKDKIVNITVRRAVYEMTASYAAGNYSDSAGRSVGNFYGATGGRFNPAQGFDYVPRYLKGGLHRGYRLPSYGPGTDKTDGFLALDQVTGAPTAWLNKDEWVINRERSSKFDRTLSAINSGGENAIRGALEKDLARFEHGGKFTAQQVLDYAHGKNVAGFQARGSLQGFPYQWAGHNWGDCSSTQGQLAEFTVGRNPHDGRFMSTGNAASQLASIGYMPGTGSSGARYIVGFWNGGAGGGHAVGTLVLDSGQRINMEMGGSSRTGKIGGNASGVDNPQVQERFYMPLPSGEGKTFAESAADGEITSTSFDGYSTSTGATVSWGKAQELYDQALDFARRTRVHDRGGVLKDGKIALNMSGKDERILTHSETRGYELALKKFPVASDKLAYAADKFDAAMSAFAAKSTQAQNQVVDFGRGFGGDWLGQTELVRDAEQGLLDTRKAIASENDDIAEREKDLAEARAELKKAEKEGGGIATAQRRRLADAEEELAKARREGNADEIAAAEKKLVRAREDVSEALEKSKDKNAKAVKSAQEKVNKAEDALAEAREKTADQADRLIAAERTVAAARYQAAGEIATNIFDSFAKGAKSMEAFFAEMSRLVEIVEQTRQAVSKLQMQQQMNAIERLKSLNTLQQRESDVARVRARGALSVAEAEAELEQARDKAALLGLTSIEAMGGAMDRFRVTGKFSIEELSASVVENASEVKAAEWGVKLARAQAALDEFEATRRQAEAQLAVAQATLTQSAAAQMLQLHTQYLAQQTQELNGMTAGQAKGASKGFGGVGKIGSGAGKLLGGIAAAAAGFATMGPLGLLLAIPAVVSGGKDVVQGSIDVHQNKSEMKEAWKSMGAGEKAAIVGGSLLGAGAGIAGGALAAKLGPDAATAGATIGAEVVDATVGSVQYATAGKLEKLSRDFEDQKNVLQRMIDAQQHKLDLEKATQEVEYLTKKDTLEAEVEYNKLQQQLATATSEKVAAALKDAAAVEAKRAGIQHAEQMDLVKETNSHLAQIVELSRTDQGTNAETTHQLQLVAKSVSALVNSMSFRPLSTASGLEYAETRRL